MQHNFYSQAILRLWLHFLQAQLQRSRMLCESTFDRVDLGRRAKLYTWQKVFPGRRVTLHTKASDPASLLALVVDRLTSRYLEPCVIFSKNQALAIGLFLLHAFFYKKLVNFGQASLFSNFYEISVSIIFKLFLFWKVLIRTTTVTSNS